MTYALFIIIMCNIAYFDENWHKLPSLRVRAIIIPAQVMDMCHVLLFMPFLLQGLLTEEIEEYNRINPLMSIVDPSPMNTIMLL